MSQRPLEPGARTTYKSFRLGPELSERLRQEAARSGCTISAVIRNALEEYLWRAEHAKEE